MDKKMAMFFLCGLFAIFVIPSAILAASFDCSKAKTETEKAICNDPILSKLDEDMAAAYSEALKTSDRDAVKKEQRKWLKETLAPCIEDKVCIKKAYENRLRQLESSALAEPTSPQDSNISSKAAAACFDRLANKALPFEIYYEYYYNTYDKVFFQPIGDKFGLSDKGFEFKPDDDARISEIAVAPLCNGNYVTIRTYYHAKFPIPLTGRIIGKDYLPLGKDFLISDTGLSEEGRQSVATIYPKGFVVVWCSWERPGRMPNQIKARLFDQLGKPLGRSFNISTSLGLMTDPIVQGLSNGGFVVLWYRFLEGTYFRVFDDKGRPKTKEIAVGKYLPEDRSQNVKTKGVTTPLSCEQILWISATKEGVIDVFMNCYLNKPDKTSPFDFAQRFDSNGRPLTGKLIGLEMHNLPSYKLALDQYVKNISRRLDALLQDDLRKSSNDRCNHVFNFLYEAAETKSLTNDQRMKDFFTEGCRIYQKNCPSMGEHVKRILEKCLQTN